MNTKITKMLFMLVLLCLSAGAVMAGWGREERRAKRQARRGVCGSSKMIGYSTPTWKVLRNNR